MRVVQLVRERDQVVITEWEGYAPSVIVLENGDQVCGLVVGEVANGYRLVEGVEKPDIKTPTEIRMEAVERRLVELENVAPNGIRGK